MTPCRKLLQNTYGQLKLSKGRLVMTELATLLTCIQIVLFEDDMFYMVVAK